MNVSHLRLRSQVVKYIRQFFDEQDFLEVHTPRLVGKPGQEPYLEPFWTKVIEPNGKSHPAALITSPEYMCKRILSAGVDKLYDLGPCFRNNEPFDGTHDPEFLMLEWYRSEAKLTDIMDDTERMIAFVAKKLGNSRFNTPFRRLTVEQAWKDYAEIDLAPLLEDRQAMARICLARNQSVALDDSWDDLFFKIFLSEIEPKIGREQPTFLCRYPKSMASLARLSSEDTRWADRVELYIDELEIANGFAELSDETEQRIRFEEEKKIRKTLGKNTWPIDERYLSALSGLKKAVGIAFGVDRLVMLLSGAASINEVLPASARERFDERF
ncbi:EF-P lysine aminoacylase GenX [Candidatus Uhrbacteria bacterium]|nr:EF-P lysine aminoacylase GenX [Candidatus Uhrbacteria bacterium]